MQSQILIILLLFGFFYPSLTAQEKPLVVATASIFADMATVISGGEVEVKMIVPIGGDPHIYEPTPGDAQLITKADLILINGLTFEGWLNELIENSGTQAKVITITEGIPPIESDKYKNSTDPHAWMDAKLGQTYIQNIKNALVELDPDQADVYDFNYNLYQQQLEDLDQEIQQQINTIPEKQRILITSHDAFRYYARRYGIRVEAVLGTSTDAEVQTSDIVRLNKIIKESNVPAVFIESTVNPKLLEQLASDNKVQVGGQLYSDSLGDKDSPAPTYIDMLKFNTATIVKALSQEVSVIESTSDKNSGSNFVLYGILGVLLIGGFFIVFRKLNAA